MMIFGRPIVLLSPEQFLKRRFLLRAAAQDQEHAGHRQIRIGQAPVEFGARERMGVAAQSAADIFVDSRHDTRGDLRSLYLCNGANRK